MRTGLPGWTRRPTGARRQRPIRAPDLGDDLLRPPEASARSTRVGRAGARVAPEALAAARGDAREGLDWLGHEPRTKVSLLFRLAVLGARAILFGLFRFRIETSGQELLPSRGGYLLVAATHRGWMDPFLVLHALPLEPRPWFLGSGASAFDRKWKEAALRLLGGMLPVWRGGVGVDQHVASAQAVLRAGGVFVLMPEGSIVGPPERPAPFRVGAALIALRTGAPIVPFAMAGTAELYLGRRMASRILRPTSAAELLGSSWDGVLPEPGSRQELELARRLTECFAEVLEPAVVELYARVRDEGPGPRRLRGLTGLLLSRPRHARQGQQRPPATPPR